MKKKTFGMLSCLIALSMLLTACGPKNNTPQNTPDPGSSSAAASENQPGNDIDYPTKPITVVVPFSAGGTTDLAARIVADSLPKYLDGATVVVTNITGGSGTIGVTEAAGADPDGYTLGISAVAAVAIQPLFGQTSYTLEDIQPICNIYTMPQCIVVPADAPYETVDEFVAYLKEQDSVNYAIAGRGTVQHLVCAEWMEQVGVQAVHLNYAGGPEQPTAILSGECAFGALQASDAIRYVESGQLKIMLNLSDFVPSWISDVPTTVSLGYQSSVGSCVGLWAPAGLDSQIAEKLSAAVEACLNDEDVQAQFQNIGIETEYLSAEEYGGQLNNTSTAAKKLMEQLGLIG